MSRVEYVIGSENINTSPLIAYSDEAIAFLGELSTTIMKSPVARMHPDVAAFAFWCRKGHLQKLKENCPESDKRLGRGVCFHVTPSNIPISFAFSYAFGLLGGCPSIVRLPSKKFSQAEALIKLLGEVLKKHPEVRDRTVFVRYPAENSITEEFSIQADVRMLWGGDKTIESIRELQAKPRCIDIPFSDRYSFCIIDAESVSEADDERVSRLAEDFYNDTYLMDQNACSSPMVICWLNDNEEGRNRFWDAVYSLAEKKYDLQAAVSVDKYTKSCEDSIDRINNISSIKHRTNLLYLVEIKELIPGLAEYRGNSGYFYEYSMKSLKDMVEIVNDRFQTVTYFGVDPEEIRKVVLEYRLRGIDRIVPIGKALDIGVIWDGFDLVRMLSRVVNVE